MQQRHKKEWKTARAGIETMKKERLKLRKSDLDEKAERKAITREVCMSVFCCVTVCVFVGPALSTVSPL